MLLGYWYVCTQVSSTCRCSFEGHRRTTNQTPSRYFTACRRITDGRDVDGYDVIRRRNGPPTCDLETDATRPPSKLFVVVGAELGTAWISSSHSFTNKSQEFPHVPDPGALRVRTHGCTHRRSPSPRTMEARREQVHLGGV